MRKSKIFAVLAGLFATVAATAQTLVTDAASELTDGTIISLQCRDKSGGAGWYFNGATQKSAFFTKQNLYVVKGNATDGLKLCRLADSQYITRSGDNIGMSGTEADGVTLTAVSYNSDENNGFEFTSDAMENKMGGSEKGKYVRLIDNNSFLNTQGNGDRPKFAGGKGGYSAWYVYKYTQDEVNRITSKVLFVEQPVSAIETDKLYLLESRGRHIVTWEDDYSHALLNGRAPAGFTATNDRRGLVRFVDAGNGNYKIQFAGTGRYYPELVNTGNTNPMYTVENADDAGVFQFLNNVGGNAAVWAIGKADGKLWMDSNGEGNLATGYGSSATTNAGGNDAFNIYPVELCDFLVMNLEVQHVCEGKVFATTTCSPLRPGLSYNFENLTVTNRIGLVAKAGQNYDHVVNDATPVQIEYDQNVSALPFKPSESLDKAHWYAMDVHSNESKYVVYAEDGNVRVTNKGGGDDHDYIKGVPSEAEQWCFIGNALDGFRIYNRAVGNGKSLYQSRDADTEITFDAAGQAFCLYAGNGQVANGCAFKMADRSYYINHRGEKMQGWTSNDGGSSFRFFAQIDEQVQALLDEIDGRWPTQEPDMDFNPTWPSEYINGGYADFNFLANAQTAVDNNDKEALAGFKTKLADFINKSNAYGYPRSIVLEFPKKAYGTAYLPFNTLCPEGLTLYECSQREGNVLTLTAGGNFEANKAYVVGADESVRGKKKQIISYGNQKGNQANADSYLKGTHDGCQAPEGSYVLQEQGGQLGFYLVGNGSNVQVPAGKCYLQLPETNANLKFLAFPDGSLTGIGALAPEAAPADAPAYDLSGRRVTKTQKGLYIIGGKKVLVK